MTAIHIGLVGTDTRNEGYLNSMVSRLNETGQVAGNAQATTALTWGTLPGCMTSPWIKPISWTCLFAQRLRL